MTNSNKTKKPSNFEAINNIVEAVRYKYQYKLKKTHERINSNSKMTI